MLDEHNQPRNVRRAISSQQLCNVQPALRDSAVIQRTLFFRAAHHGDRSPLSMAIRLALVFFSCSASGFRAPHSFSKAHLDALAVHLIFATALVLPISSNRLQRLLLLIAELLHLFLLHLCLSVPSRQRHCRHANLQLALAASPCAW